MENKRKKLLKEIKEEFGSNIEILSLIYNDKEELEKEDLKKVEKFINNIKSKKAILILHGEGGCTRSGRSLCLLFRKKFNKGFCTMVPQKVCSALLYTTLISTVVILGEKSFITPIDPYFYYKGRNLRAAIHFYDADLQLRKKARKHWENASNFCLKILHTPGSVTVHPDRLSNNNIDNIVRFLLNPKTHGIPVYHTHLKKMNFEHEIVEEEDILWKKVNLLLNESLIELSKTNNKFLIENSSKSYFCKK